MRDFTIWGKSMVEANMFGQIIVSMRETGRKTTSREM